MGVYICQNGELHSSEYEMEINVKRALTHESFKRQTSRDDCNGSFNASILQYIIPINTCG